MKNHNEVFKSYQVAQKLEGMISNPAPNLCLNTSIDAISTFSDGIYVFQGDYYYRVEMGKPIDYSEYPKRINETFTGLPSNLDTVLTVPKIKKTYFFKVRQPTVYT